MNDHVIIALTLLLLVTSSCVSFACGFVFSRTNDRWITVVACVNPIIVWAVSIFWCVGVLLNHH